MTDHLIRIMASQPGYRRGGIALGPDWQVIDTSGLARAQQLALLADPAVVIEGHDGEDVWLPLSAEIRAGLVSLLEGSEPEGDVVEGDGSGKALAELDPELLAAAELGRDLESAIADNQGFLEGFDLWPVEDPARLFVVVVDRLADAGAEIERLTSELETLKTTAAAEPSGDGGSAQVGADGAENGGEGGQQGGGRQDPPAPAPEAAASASPPAPVKTPTRSGRGKAADKKAV